MEEMKNSIFERFPLHWLVWKDDHIAIEEELKKIDVDRERRDPRGRTPLMLAVTLGHTRAARVLINNGCNVNADNRDGWSVAQEAIATGDPELAQMVLRERDVRRYSVRATSLPAVLQRLTEAPDFYVEMKWEFSSWVPLMARMCPHDTYKVYKQGSRVRIDTTLLGFEDGGFERGDKSFIFQGKQVTAKHGNRSHIYTVYRTPEGDRVVVTEVDHVERVVVTEEIQLASRDVLAQAVGADRETIEARLTTPIVTTYLDTEKIEFKWNLSGIWGFRTGHVDEVNGRQCKVFTANNVELVTKSRTEHLTEKGRERAKAFVKSPLHSILAAAETEDRANPAAAAPDLAAVSATWSDSETASSPEGTLPPAEPLYPPAPGPESLGTAAEAYPEAPDPSSDVTECSAPAAPSSSCDPAPEVSESTTNPSRITPEEYFDPACDLGERDIGRPRISQTKIQKLKATLWLCEDYPLSLQEQAMPIVDLMAIHSTHFLRLKEFIQMQLPAGFPVKIEIPLFHVLTARISFCNIFAMEEPVPHVSVIEETPAVPAPEGAESGAVPARLTCVLEDAVFEPPASYRRGSSSMRSFGGADDDELLQMAIQQSLLDQGTEDEQVDLYQALRAGPPSPARGIPSADVDEQMLQRAIELSLAPGGGPTPPSEARPPPPSAADSEEAQVAAALELSRREESAADRRRREEEEMVRRALELSLVEQ